MRDLMRFCAPRPIAPEHPFYSRSRATGMMRLRMLCFVNLSASVWPIQLSSPQRRRFWNHGSENSNDCISPESISVLRAPPVRHQGLHYGRPAEVKARTWCVVPIGQLRSKIFLMGIGWGQELRLGLFYAQEHRPREGDSPGADVLAFEKIHDDVLHFARG
jgi:hypothetical protein